MLKTVSSAGGGSSGFPITLGNTVVTASSTTTTLGNLTLNNVTINGTTENGVQFSNVNVISGNIANVAIANATITGGTVVSNLTGSTIPAANVTGLGTMATENANNVAITGGTIGNVTYSNVTVISGTEGNVTYSNVNIQSGNATLTAINLPYNGASSSVGPINVGGNMVGGPDTGLVGTFVGSANSYTYMFQQNTSNGTAAYSTYTIANNDYTAYANFGINNNAFVGSPSNAFNNARNAYFYSHGGDAVFGSYTANAVHFIANGTSSTTDAMTINSNNTVTIQALAQGTSSNATFATASLPLVPAGYIIVNNGGTNVKIPYYAV